MCGRGDISDKRDGDYQFSNIQIGVSPHVHLPTPPLSIFNISTMMNASCTRPSMSTPMSTWIGQVVPLLETCFPHSNWHTILHH